MKQYYKKISIILLLFLILTTFYIFGQAMFNVYADIPKNSNVLSDLQRDSNFDIGQYPINNNDGSINVIQIAESNNNTLILYTYQPCQMTKKMTATSVNMSFTEEVSDTELYFLKLLSTSNVFCKYEVVGVTLPKSDYRYYNITSIYRPWDENFDAPSGNDNTKNEIAFAVGRLYKASTIDGKVTYTYEYPDIIEILNPYADFLEYSNGFWLATQSCRSHYIAFDTDKQIDFLKEATITFVHQKCHSEVGTSHEGTTKGPEILEKDWLVKATEEGQTSEYGHPWFTKKFEWNRIQSTEEFKKTETLKDETIKNLEGTKWVLRFYETDFKSFWDGMGGYTDYTEVSSVSILRLKFITNGRLYDLGTVSDKITEDNVAGGGEKNKYDPFRWLKDLANKLGIPTWVFILIIVLLIFAIALPILSLIFPIVGQVLKVVFKAIVKVIEWILKALIWIIELPFKAIVWVINKCKGGDSA